MQVSGKALIPILVGVILGLLAIVWQQHRLLDTGTRGSSAPASYATAVNNAAPAVVNIYSTKILPGDRRHPLLNSPLFRQFFGLPNRRQQQRFESSLGSGVIVDRNGFVLTNHHVIDGANEILVALRDGRETHARIIGSDPDSDLALLQIPLKDLPEIRTRQNDDLQIGDVVLAIGNPFNVGQTVTMGIVSATGRSGEGLSVYGEYIQTDAAINEGNSGGALVDSEGLLVGINTAVYSTTSGSEGISFAIPWSTANRVMSDLIRHGRVLRGWLGISVVQVENRATGAIQLLITGITAKSPAEKYGLQKGDIITTINNEQVITAKHAMQQLGQTRPGDIVRIQFLRSGNAAATVDVEMGVRPENPSAN